MEKIFKILVKDKTLTKKTIILNQKMFIANMKSISMSKKNEYSEELERSLKNYKKKLEQTFNINILDIKKFVKDFNKFLIAHS